MKNNRKSQQQGNGPAGRPPKAGHSKPLTPEQQALVERNIGLAYKLANQYRRELGPADYDDLCSSCLMALTFAARRFDASRDVKFSTYATHVIFTKGVSDFFQREFSRRHSARRRGVRSHSSDLSGRDSGLLSTIPQRDGALEWTEQEWEDLLSVLSPERRRLIVWVFRHGLGVVEIAGRFGKNPRVVQALLKEALAELRTQFAVASVESPKNTRPDRQETLNSIRRLHSEKKTDGEIAELLGLSRRAVREIRGRRLGLPTIHSDNDHHFGFEDRVERVKQLHSLGRSDAEIAAELQTAVGTVSRIRCRLRLPPNQGASLAEVKPRRRLERLSRLFSKSAPMEFDN
jgi:RNA polymerase sigma factor (sigma-70 family)